jgi:hypothetical protein
MKTKGGMVSIKPPYTAVNAFSLFISNSDIHYFSHGTFGIIFEAILKKSTDGLPSPYISFTPDSGAVDLRKIIFKLVFLNDDKLIEYPFDIENENSTFQNPSRRTFNITTVTSDNFKNETNIQVDIHDRTCDYGEPICPSVIFSKIISDDELSSFAQTLLETNTMGTSLASINIKSSIHHFVTERSIKNITKIGIIAMEFAENYYTLYDILKENVNTELRMSKENYMCMALYLLIELYKLGYVHRDHHSRNILINIDYENYFYGGVGRPLIIDFGKTRLLNQVFDEDKLLDFESLYRETRYTELLKQLNVYHNKSQKYKECN